MRMPSEQRCLLLVPFLLNLSLGQHETCSVEDPNCSDKEFTLPGPELTGEIGDVLDFPKLGLQRLTVSSSPPIFDKNGDQKLDIDEMRTTLENNFDVYLGREDVLEMYESLQLDANGDQFIEQNEMSSFDLIDSYVKRLTDQKPQLKGRHSDHAFLFPNKLADKKLLAIVERVSQLLHLPRALVNKSDMQIGVLLRNPTIYFFITSVEGTIISILIRELFTKQSHAAIDLEKLREEFLLDLHKHCDKATLRVRPEKGKAVLWYNHHEGEEGEWFGDVDQLTHHGSCPVLEGEKWVANFWIKITDDREWDLLPTHQPPFI